MTDLVQLVYVSKATQEMTGEDLTKLLLKIRPNNQLNGITGMLLFDGGSFMQVIEGKPKDIAYLFSRIQLDSRHKNIVHLLEKPIAKRQFPDWSMGFRDITDAMLESVEGLNDFFITKSCLANVDASRAVRILDAFAKGRWQ